MSQSFGYLWPAPDADFHLARPSLTVEFWRSLAEGGVLEGGFISSLVIQPSLGTTRTVDSIKDAIISHMLKSAGFAWYCPEVGTPVESARRALEGWRPSSQTSCRAYVVFDGQFGAMRAA